MKAKPNYEIVVTLDIRIAGYQARFFVPVWESAVILQRALAESCLARWVHRSELLSRAAGAQHHRAGSLNVTLDPITTL